MTTSPRRLYLARDSMLLGVCRGIARYADVPVGLVRAAAVLIFLCTGFWPGGALYLLLWLLLDKEPLYTAPQGEPAPYGTRAETMHVLRTRMQRLDTRLRSMEDHVTRADFDWEERLRRG